MSEVSYAISHEECVDIRNLYEKRLALENLAKIVSPSDSPKMYERLVSDYGKTVRLFEEWWAAMFKKYEIPAGNYTVDFVYETIVLTEKT